MIDTTLPDLSAMLNYPTDTPTEEKPRFCVNSERNAEWVLKLLADNRSELARIKAQHAKRVAELEADFNRLNARWSAELQAWAREEATRRRRQTVTLSQGDLAFTRRSACLIISDPSDALTTAKAVYPDAVTVETVVNEKFDSAAFLRFAEEKFTQTGEVLPGVARQEAGETFAIRLPKPPKEEGGDKPTE